MTIELHQERLRRITMPWHVADRRRWGEAVLQTGRDLRRSNALEWAAVVSFYAFVSVFPLLLAAMIAASWFVDPAWATTKATSLLGAVLPEGQETIAAILEDAIAQRGRTGVLAVGVLLVTGRRVLGALTKALNLVSDVDEREDPLPRRVAVEASLVAGLVAVVLLAFAARPLLDLLWGTLGILPGPDRALLPVAHHLLRAVLLVVAFTLVYAVVPRGERFWRAAFTGAVVATGLFLMARAAFIVLFDLLWPNLTLIYGPLAVAALLLSWGWYLALITLAGGALASHIKVMILEGRSAASAAEIHTR